jgi:DNA repair exonuclease SbcCD nuclease subunit
MEFLATADWHLAVYSQDPPVAKSSLLERLYYLNKVIRSSIIEYAIKNKVGKIVVAGDTNHTKSIIHSVAQSVLLEIVRDYREIEFIVIDGNHDMSSKSGAGVSALKCLDHEPNVDMIHEPKQIENILFVPWNPKTMIKTITECRDAEYLVSHFGLNEGMLNSGISIVSEVALRDIQHFRCSLLGHYHMPQEIILDDTEVYYIGSPIQLDWGEKNDEKRFLLVNSDLHEIDSIEIDGYKRHVELELTPDKMDETLKIARKLKKEGHHIKLLKTEDLDLSDIQMEFNIVDKVEKDITNRGISTNMSMSDILNRYMEIKKVPKGKVDFYRSIALDVISEVGG